MLLCQRMLSISENCENPLQKNDDNLNDFFLGGGKFIFEINILVMNQKAGRCNQMLGS